MTSTMGMGRVRTAFSDRSSSIVVIFQYPPSSTLYLNIQYFPILSNIVQYHTSSTSSIIFHHLFQYQPNGGHRESARHGPWPIPRLPGLPHRLSERANALRHLQLPLGEKQLMTGGPQRNNVCISMIPYLLITGI